MKRLIAIAILISGCSSHKIKDNGCKFIMGHYNIISTPLAGLPNLSIDKLNERSLDNIKKCYPKNPFLKAKIRLESVKVSKTGKVYIIFSPEGVTDVKVVFETDVNGNIIGVYQAAGNLT